MRRETVRPLLAVLLLLGSGAMIQAPGQDKADDNSGRPSKRAQRTDRWGISFEWTNGQDVLRFWGGLDCHLLVDKFNGNVLLYKDLNAMPPQGEGMAMTDFNKTNKRVWFRIRATDQNTSCVAVALALGLKKVPNFIAFLIPRELEDELLAKELAHGGLKEQELDEKRYFTVFKVAKKDGKYEVKVVEQKADK